MTTLWIRSEPIPLTLNLPFLAAMDLNRFIEFCQANPDLRIERTATGELIVMSPAFADTGHRNSAITAQLWIWAEHNGTGISFDSSTGFTLPNGAIRSPDAAWLKLDRWNRLTPTQQASFAPICPDFVIELRSASDSLSTLQAKMQEYIDNGASLGWLIDPDHHTVHIYRPQQPPVIVDHPETISADPELPGFILQMHKIWPIEAT